MKVHLHQTHQTIADFAAIKAYLVEHFVDRRNSGVHVFPELYLSGYPLQDLCLQNPFITRYEEFLREVNALSRKIQAPEENLLLLGGLEYVYDERTGIPKRIQNAIYELRPGADAKPVYRKILLPNYDIFDERKYFFPGDRAYLTEFRGKTIGALICEDMWPSTYHDVDPTTLLGEHAKRSGKKLDLVVNLSASPYNLHKQGKRVARGSEISKTLGAPFVYVNRVGGEDEILFDGGSFMVNGDALVAQTRLFSPETLTLDLPAAKGASPASGDLENTWESLFAPDLVLVKGALPTLRPLSDEACAEVVQALGFGVQEYARKSGFRNYTVALSGGMDSALVVAILKLALKPGQLLEAVYMPSEFSRDISRDLSVEMCRKADIPFYELPIQDVHRACRDLFRKHIRQDLAGLADENIQSRMRGMLIYARSNQSGSMVVNTSNKSELAVGYSTIYGDSVGAISMLGDLYKSEVFALARYINRKHRDLIPEGIITRPPSAELREDQQDTDSLPPYERLDAMLEGILSYRMNADELIASGFGREEVERTVNLYRKSEYKRAQFCPILKVKGKSFGFGYRIPINKDSGFYLPRA